MVESFDDGETQRVMLPPLIDLRNQALLEQANGETAEFF
jgi:hypothetical protein